jgi:hypothetical protein
MEEFQRCQVQSDLTACEASGCVLVNASFFGTDMPPEDKCIPCMAFDDQQMPARPITRYVSGYPQVMVVSLGQVYVTLLEAVEGIA